LGRFLTQDSYLGEFDDPPSVHRYLYANANPLFFTDPSGYYSWSEFKGDAKWAMDFTVAYHKDLLLNGPTRVLRVAGSTLKQAGEFAVETVAMAHDTVVLGADAALRVTTGEGFDNITLYSSLAENSAQRIAQGDNVGDIIKDSAKSFGVNLATVGTYETFKEYHSLGSDYASGKIRSIDEVEDRLIHAAGGAVLNATLSSAGSRVAGRGWLGRRAPRGQSQPRSRAACLRVRLSCQVELARGRRVLVARSAGSPMTLGAPSRAGASPQTPK